MNYARRLCILKLSGPGGSIRQLHQQRRKATLNGWIFDGCGSRDFKIKKRRTGNCEENRFFSVWSVELYFGIDVCFWLLYKIFIQKLIL